MQGEIFDDIIIGAGSAGAPLAARLSADPARRVALIEAGPDYSAHTGTPADLLDGNVMSLVDHDWRFAADVMSDRTIRFPQGKVTGGSSSVGNTVAIRGMPGDYDEWAEAGNTEWSWSKVLPHFLALEDDLDFGGEFHGRGGPVPIRRWRPDELTVVQQSFLDSCLAAGYPRADDHNHPESTGVGPIPSNRRDARTRVSTAAGYLTAARARENLTILADTLVDRVLLRDGMVRGVAVVTGSSCSELRARRVVVAAGAVCTPAILMRSGIGPEDDLRRLGIDVRVGLPGVGRGLIDQPRTGVFLVPKPGAENIGKSTGQIVLRTAAAGSGRVNDMYYAMINGFDLAHQFPHLRRAADADRVFGVMVVAREPRSRGRVTLVSTDPHEQPRIELNYLSDESDYRLLADGVRVCWELAQSPKVRDWGERVVMLDESTIDSDDAVRAYVKATVDSTYNPIGTARMGLGGDPASVVDQRCAVYGVDGLYIADASVMPAMVRANINLTAIMIGERVAELLRAE
ncbi:GMC family oxidoreductase N-terminal domain-containing protein [Nocardia terpenica]|uniref:GMC family oxidoreductase n=1 Tax=Nocardia terpenica TaxID=455432 RepID=UPI00189403B2|nr:GMC oxidoreductase [Nocardia terpenica]MBF6061107.1 GMC family oxidoreductase N-terminal domain-containing protein [Nocardia terpenica]MBF6105664.1 GMC family oxidoreductase N-terminal domain-containing protein [Nocardia terpenica]MBF6112866.1 GMC family oxidoreductase N-terminal domain-containing protein [Nocardia terpenica]MBF6118996.1 GMC family oxidoreductase N-terminal domain-containing protein [Nocardia terpenica]